MVEQHTTQYGDRHRWKILGIGVAANASFAAVFQGLPTTSVLMRMNYNLSNDQLGLALGLLGMGIAVSEIPWGLLTDRWGDRRVLLTGLGATSIALCLFALFGSPTADRVPGPWQLALGLFFVGLLGGSVNGSSGRAVMSWFKKNEQGYAMSIRQIAYPLGGGIGALLLPVVASRFGFNATFAVLAFGCVTTAAFTWVWLHESPEKIRQDAGVRTPAPGDAGVAAKDASAARSPLRDFKIWRMIAAIGLFSVPQFAVITFASIFLHDVCKAGIVVTAGIMIVIQSGAIAARIWSGRWTDRHGNRRYYLIRCSLLVAVSFAVLALSLFVLGRLNIDNSLKLVIISALLIVSGVCASAWTGIANAELAVQVGIRRVGTALGMCNTAVYTALFFAPYFTPIVAKLWSWPAAWLMASLFAFSANALFRRT
ncbi:MFS transporter [Paraburkholderia megapolitana]|uniref:Sugar phosphate permease n=1 Tax=Paraburkholderia megapolitana TaxID=420953 RepID=A0A1I3TUE2_9BURK|nr:MFS transporter [Paraburkholderia megapolitana]QDQ83396.1 MFS transporter [Paraburkholderia megapolitana]SFJ73256.1 Sugar phosphate permease [Paraburkholderia megapolitana]